MKVRTRSRVLAVAISMCTLLLLGVANSSSREASEVDKMVSQELSGDRTAVTTRNLGASLSAQLSDAVTEWNEHAVNLTLLPASALSPVQQTRVMAIIQVSVHDAVNGITGEYATYLSPGPAPANASPEAAAIAAAHYALKNIPGNQGNLFESQSAMLDSLYSASLTAHGLSEGDPGIEYGRSAAAAILALRAYDHSAQAQFDYNAPGVGTPGVWVRLNNVPALLPGWGNVTPFVLRSSSQFRPDAPPALDSEQYARDYNEIKQIGALNSSTRTDEQTRIALFWRASPTAIWNPVLRQAIAAQNLNLSAKARAIALFYLAAADASIACWGAKYFYNFWRPQLAIMGGEIDGNALTTGDAAWQPFLPTPPHPEYPSAHTTNSTAMATILEFLFGEGPDELIVVTQSGITRQWYTFDEGAKEVIDARVYSGIHFRTADEEGAKLGTKVARFISTHALRPCRKRKSRCF
jgi:PAP2 superfamily